MSFSRHACRHALQRPAVSFLDHVWISEDLLASTFRRFVNCQRRHGSQVPGPLEANRRLAKRRSTALASAGGSGPSLNFANLFGLNGSEHMRWNDSQPVLSKPESLGKEGVSVGSLSTWRLSNIFKGAFSCPSSPPGAPLPLSLDEMESADTDDFDDPPSLSVDHTNVNKTALDLEITLKRHWKVEYIKKVIQDFRLDLQREPAYSHMIFSHMLSRCFRHREPVFEQVIAFLDDSSLNTPGASNYLAVVEHLALHKPDRASRDKYLQAIYRAVELGLVPTEEIGLIIRALPNIKMGTETLRTGDPGDLAHCYRGLWNAIQSCSVLHFKDLGEEIMNSWLDELAATPPNRHILLLAKDIVSAIHDSGSKDCPWIPGFILQWMSLPSNSPPTDSPPDCPPTDYLAFSLCDHRRAKDNANYVSNLLRPFNADLASKYIIQVTETLAFSFEADQSRRLVMQAWRECLAYMPNATSLVSSRVWLDVQPFETQHCDDGLPDNAVSSFAKHHRILLRIWLLKSLNRPFSKVHLKETDPALYRLLTHFDAVTRRFRSGHGNLLTNLTNSLQELDLPFNNILVMAIFLTTREKTPLPAQTIFQQLETGKTTLMDVFADVETFEATKPYFFPTFSWKVRKTDVTSPSFIEKATRLARTDIKNALAILRILRLHVPLQIALSRSWMKLDPAEKALVPYAEYNGLSSYYPDPRACLELINCLAISIACSNKLSPNQSFRMLCFLYRFLLKHGAPIEPTFVRALYHSGVVRFRQAGRSVPPAQRWYILNIVRKVEGKKAVRELLNEELNPGADLTKFAG